MTDICRLCLKPIMRTKDFRKGANAKAKANAAQGLPELIEIASGVRYTPNTKPKHNKDAKHGWYRYESRFTLPVFGDNVY